MRRAEQHDAAIVSRTAARRAYAEAAIGPE
jgi:hypothetical protein